MSRSNVLSRVRKHSVKMKSIQALNHRVRKTGNHGCHHVAGEMLRLRENGGLMTKVEWQVGGGVDSSLCPPASGTEEGHARLTSTFPGRLVLPSRNAGGDVVIPGRTDNASVIISVSARHPLSVTAQLPGLSDACRGFHTASHLLVVLERNL